MLRAFLPLVALVSIFASKSGFAANYKLFVGEMKTMDLGKIERVAVGNGGLVSTSILQNGNLLVLAEKPGDTEVQVWLPSGKIIAHKFYIVANNTARDVAEIKSLLGDIQGLQIRQVGKNIVLQGDINTADTLQVRKVADAYSNILNLARLTTESDLDKLLAAMPELTVNKAGGKTIVSGEISEQKKNYLGTVNTLFPDVVDVTTTTDSKRPMVYMKVQITEFNTRAVDELGINWSTNFQGPNLNYQKVFDDYHSSAIGGPAAGGFFGITTSITSRINLAASSGDALMLASPTLSALSGAKAEFLAGGEFPIQISNGTIGNSIEFKEYGIKLIIEPVVSIDGSIVAQVETEISSIDNAVAVGNTPGFKTRRTKTQVSLKEGQTLAISGLATQQLSKDYSKLAGLGDIPLLGSLFRNRKFDHTRTDLVVFITPQVYSPENALNQEQLMIAEQLKEKFMQRSKTSMEILD